MTDPAETPYSPPAALARLGDDSVYSRIFLVMGVVAVVAAAILWVKLGQSFALGFLLGSGLSFLNLLMLRRAITNLGDSVVTAGKTGAAALFLTRYLFRFILIAAVGYVIFKGSLISVYGLLAGLFLPVAGLMGEAAYEAWIAFRTPENS